MASINPVLRFGSLLIVIFTVGLSLVILLPIVKKSSAYKSFMSVFRPVLPYIGWVLFLVGLTWTLWGAFQPGEVKLIVGLGLVLLVQGIYIVKIGYEDGSIDSSDATNLKVVSLCTTFAVAFLFLILTGSAIAKVFK